MSLNKITLSMAIVLGVGIVAAVMSGSLTPPDANEAQLVNLHAPAHGRRGEEVPVTLTFTAPDGCVDVGRAEARVDEEQQQVTFSASLNRRDGLCPQMVWHPETIVTFTPRHTGRYHLKAQLWPEPGDELSYAHLRLGIDFKRPYKVPIDVTVHVQVTD